MEYNISIMTAEAPQYLKPEDTIKNSIIMMGVHVIPLIEFACKKDVDVAAVKSKIWFEKAVGLSLINQDGTMDQSIREQLQQLNSPMQEVTSAQAAKEVQPKKTPYASYEPVQTREGMALTLLNLLQTNLGKYGHKEEQKEVIDWIAEMESSGEFVGDIPDRYLLRYNQLQALYKDQLIQDVVKNIQRVE